MGTDFRDAAERHWEDGKHLISNSKIANADHLLGLSAECALKAVMKSLGLQLRQDGAPTEKKYRVHINQLWDEFNTFADSRNGLKYTAKICNLTNPFNNWDVNQRYHHRSDFTQNQVDEHEQAAQTAMSILQDAILDGVVI